MTIEIGTKHEASILVSEKNTAKTMGSGSLDVFATPSMVALMEQAASELCDKFADEGITTVGTQMNISHLSATPLGVQVNAVAEVTSCDGRKVCFDVSAYDCAGLIGKGTHERFCIKIDKFMSKTLEKSSCLDTHAELDCSI